MISATAPRLPRRTLAITALLVAAPMFVVPTRAGAQAPSAPPVPVTVVAAGRRDVPLVLRNIGAVQAYQTAAIRPRVDGTLEQVLFTEGQEVKKGDLLARIDARPYQAVLDQAVARKAQDEALLANAKLNLTRSAQLARSQFTSQQVVDTQAATVAQLEATVRADQAAIAAAQVNLDYTSITAPFDGRMGLRNVDAGNVVRFADNSNTAIATISQLRPIVVLFTLPQDQLPAIQAAMTHGKLPAAALSSDDKVVLGQGELLTMDSAIDATTGTIRLKAVFPNQDTRLWPGQFVNVRLTLGVDRGVIAVPSIAVQRGPAGLHVYIVKDDQTVGLAPVELGQDDGTLAVIRSGLDEGARVVVAGQSRLRVGARVTITAPAAAPRPSG